MQLIPFYHQKDLLRFYGKIGLIVDAVKEVVALEDEQVEKLPYDNNDENHFVSAVGKVDGSLISLLDIGVGLCRSCASL